MLHLSLLFTVVVGGLIVYSVATVKLPQPPVEFIGPPVLLNDGPICPGDTLRREHQIAINQAGRVCLSLTVFDMDRLRTVEPERMGMANCFNWPELLVGRVQVIRRDYVLPDLPAGHYALVGTMFKQDGAYGRFELPFIVSECDD